MSVTDPERLPLPLAQRVDEACDRFEAAWASGQQPRIEDYLVITPEPDRAALLRELIQAEVYHRRQASLARRKAADEEIARTKAEEARDEARAVVERVASVGPLQVLEKQEQLTPEQVTLLKALVAYYQRYVQEEAREEQERARQARAYAMIGFLQTRLSFSEEAAAAYSQAIRLREQLAAAFPTEQEYVAHLGIERANLGQLFRDLGKRREAETEFRRALEIQQRLTKEYPKADAYRAQLADTYHYLGILVRDLGRRKEAEIELGRALALQQQLADESPDVPKYPSSRPRAG